MNPSNVAIVVLLILMSCSANKKPTKAVRLNDQLMASYFGSKQQLIILPCTRCGCFVDALNNLKEEDRLFLKRYSLISDTTCNKLHIPFEHLAQRTLDSISQDIYNVTLIKKVDQTYKARIIETAESSRLIEICREFFSSK